MKRRSPISGLLAPAAARSATSASLSSGRPAQPLAPSPDPRAPPAQSHRDRLAEVPVSACGHRAKALGALGLTGLRERSRRVVVARPAPAPVPRSRTVASAGQLGDRNVVLTSRERHHAERAGRAGTVEPVVDGARRLERVNRADARCVEIATGRGQRRLGPATTTIETVAARRCRSARAPLRTGVPPRPGHHPRARSVPTRRSPGPGRIRRRSPHRCEPPLPRTALPRPGGPPTR